MSVAVQGAIITLFILGAYITISATKAAESNKDKVWAKALPQVVPSENECRPYIEKAIKKLTTDNLADNDYDSTDQNQDERFASPSDIENLPDNDIATTDRQNEKEKKEETETPVVQVSEVTEDGEEVIVPSEQSDEEEEQQKNSVKKSGQTTEQSDHEIDDGKEDQTNENESNDDDEAKSSTKVDDKRDDNLRYEKLTLDDKKNDYVSDKEKAFNTADSASQIQNTHQEEDNVRTSGDDQDHNSKEKQETEEDDSVPEEELAKDRQMPKKLRNRIHIEKILLNLEKEESVESEKLKKLTDSTLKELKKLYENAIKPMETLYKYRDLSNRHFGDPEIFSKPLILFMGPWSGGKSTIINYLLENEFSVTALRTGAEPSPAYFNIITHNNNKTIVDGTQLAADWTFSGLQKFGQGLLDRLKGLQLPNPLLEKVNIVEIPGILEIRKQVERMFPFNDACQWFIDRADIIFLVYDPSKLDVGPETEAILDQLKGREYQTRIILNKADQVRAEELMRIQSTLIWNISPLMSSIEPPIMYAASLWSLPYEKAAPAKLLNSQEVAFLKDLRMAIDKRVENKISSARRFAVRVRNHAKMVDCYLTTYYNHKSFFGNRKKVSDDIIEHPQNYHIYEGLSTLTNISRYDLPDPDVYRDFFRLHPVYEFQKLSDTCTYFRGCPINRLDIVIAYDLPELVGKYKKSLEIISTGGDVAVPPIKKPLK